MPCVFCNSEQHRERIVAESENFYAIPTVGQISDGGHMLVIPKEHEVCLGALSVRLMDEFIDFKRELGDALKEEYGDFICFEHGIIGQSVPHAHLQMLPSNTDLFQPLKREYPFHREIKSMRELQDVFDSRRVYLFYENQQERMNVFYMDAIPQYLRLVAAKEMGRTPRGDWKAWRSDPTCASIDDELMKETVTRLKRHTS